MACDGRHSLPDRLAGFGLRRPKALNPGRSLAGTVESVGKDVTDFERGDEVYGTCDGSLVEYARARARRLAPKPANLSFEQAAAVPVSALIALQAVRDQAEVQAGQEGADHRRVGRRGHVRRADCQGLRGRGHRRVQHGQGHLVRSVGADHVIDYTRDDFADGEHRYDAILDIGGNRRLSHLRRAVTPRGRLVIVGGETGGRWLGGSDRGLRALLLSPLVSQKLGTFVASENAGDLLVLRQLLEAGAIAPAIERTYPLSDVPAAIRHVIEGRARGKVVIVV